MAISFFLATSQNQTSATSNSMVITTLAGSGGAGVSMVVIVSSDSTTSVSTMVDGSGNTFHLLKKITNGAETVEMWGAAAAAGTFGNITITMAANGTFSACAGLYQGVASFNTSNTASGTGSANSLTNPALAAMTSGNWYVGGGGGSQIGAANIANTGVTARSTTNGTSTTPSSALIDSTSNTALGGSYTWRIATTNAAVAVEMVASVSSIIFTRRQRGWGY